MGQPKPSASPPSRPIRDLADHLRQLIRDGHWVRGDKLPTIQRLSAEQGVSVYQAREAVLLLVREGILETRRGAGTFVVESDAGTTAAPPIVAPDAESGTDAAIATRSILLLTPQGPDDQASRLCAALTHRFQGTPWTLARHHLAIEQPLAPQLQRLRDDGAASPRGVIVHGLMLELEHAVERVFGQETIMVETMTDSAAGRAVHRVGPDYDAVRRIAADHLLRANHRRIGVITHRRLGPVGRRHPQIGDASGRNHGLVAFGRTVRERLGRGALVIHRQRGAGARRVDEIVDWLDRPDRPTAVFGHDFRIAMVIRAAERLGLRIPEDLEVLGEGNTMWAEEFEFPSIDLRLGRIASHIAALLERDPDEMRHSRSQFFVEPCLVERPETRKSKPLAP